MPSDGKWIVAANCTRCPLNTVDICPVGEKEFGRKQDGYRVVVSQNCTLSSVELMHGQKYVTHPITVRISEDPMVDIASVSSSRRCNIEELAVDLTTTSPPSEYAIYPTSTPQSFSTFIPRIWANHVAESMRQEIDSNLLDAYTAAYGDSAEGTNCASQTIIEST